MMFNPRIITTVPEIQLIQRVILPMRLKVEAKIILRVTKIALKPRIKLIVPAISLGFPNPPVGVWPVVVLSPDIVSLGDKVPPIMERYEGISGSTQGERKDKKPAKAQVSAYKSESHIH